MHAMEHRLSAQLTEVVRRFDRVEARLGTLEERMSRLEVQRGGCSGAAHEHDQ